MIRVEMIALQGQFFISLIVKCEITLKLDGAKTQY